MKTLHLQDITEDLKYLINKHYKQKYWNITMYGGCGEI